MIAVAALQYDWSLDYWDIEQLFVQSEINRDIFMRMPDGNDELSGEIVKLAKSLNGLRQSPRIFNHQLLLMSKLLAFSLGVGRLYGEPSSTGFKFMDE